MSNHRPDPNALGLSLLLLAAALAGTAPLEAQQPDVTITVPVQLANLPADLNGFQVRCNVMDDTGATVRAAEAVGAGFTVTPIIPLDTHGGYDGPVVIEMTFPELDDTAKSRLSEYACSLWLNVPAFGGARPYFASEAEPGWPAQAQAQDGTELVWTVQGSLTGG